MKQARNIIVKTCLTADEFVDFTGDCRDTGKTQSALLRDLWRNARNGTPHLAPPGRPTIGQRPAIFPSRSARRPELRLRN